MKQYHTSITINGTLNDVWRELTNFKSYPDWNPIVGKLEGEMKEGQKISTYIVPLKGTFYPVLLRYHENRGTALGGSTGRKVFAGCQALLPAKSSFRHPDRIAARGILYGSFFILFAQKFCKKNGTGI